MPLIIAAAYVVFAFCCEAWRWRPVFRAATRREVWRRVLLFGISVDVFCTSAMGGRCLGGAALHSDRVNVFPGPRWPRLCLHVSTSTFGFRRHQDFPRIFFSPRARIHIRGRTPACRSVHPRGRQGPVVALLDGVPADDYDVPPLCYNCRRYRSFCSRTIHVRRQVHGRVSPPRFPVTEPTTIPSASLVVPANVSGARFVPVLARGRQDGPRPSPAAAPP